MLNWKPSPLCRIGLSLPMGIWLLCCQAIAAGQTMTFTGHLVQVVQCIVNEGHVVEVSFGNVNVATLDTRHDKHPLVYTLTCPGLGTGNTVILKLEASHTGTGDPSTMGTDIVGLNIQLLKDDVVQETGKPFRVDLLHLPRLELQLVKAPGFTPALKNFEATGTLTAEYQ